MRRLRWERGPGRGLAFVLTLVLAGTALAQPERPFLLTTEADVALMEQGRTQLLHLRLPEAERTFRRLAERPRGRMAARYHLATAALLRAYLTDEVRYYDLFFEQADTLATVLDDAPASVWTDYVRAEVDLQRALAAAKLGRQWKAAAAGRSAYHGFRRLTEAHPGFADAYKGMGLIHITLGSLPKTYQSVLRLFGFSGSVEEGRAELERTADHGRYGRIEAGVVLSLIDVLLYRSGAEARRRLGALAQAHPESPLLAYLHGYALFSNRQAEEAAERFHQAAAHDGDPAYFYIDFVDYYLAETSFRLNRFDEAEAFYRRYLARNESGSLKPRAWLGLGLSLELQGRRAEALEAYERVEERRGIDADRTMRRAAERRMRAPMTDRGRRMILGRTAFDGGRYAEARRLLEPLATSGASADERAEATYWLGRVHLAEGRQDAALMAFGQAVVLGAGEGGPGWAAWSEYYRGEIFAARGQYDRAEAAFRAALGHSGPFDYEEALEQSAKVALGRIADGKW